MINTTIDLEDLNTIKPEDIAKIAKTPMGHAATSRNTGLTSPVHKSALGSNTMKAATFRAASVERNAMFSRTMNAAFFDKRNVSKLEEKLETMDLSDGFKKVLPYKPKDKKMIIPIAGYGGHRRGDRS